MKTVLIADDHLLIRLGLEQIIERIPGLAIVAMAANGDEAIALIASKMPDIAILDIKMPLKNGIEVLQYIKKNSLTTKVIMNSMLSDFDTIKTCKDLGAEGYVFKDASDQELKSAIETVLQGQDYYSDAVKRMMAATVGKESYTQEMATQLGLSIVDYSVLKLIVNGKSDEEIISELNLNNTDFEGAKTNLYAKLKARNVADLVRITLQRNIV